MTRREPRKNAKLVLMSTSDRARLKCEIGRAGISTRLYRRLRALKFLADGWTPSDIPEIVGCGEATVRRARMRYDQGGPANVLNEKSRSGRPRKFSKKQETRIIAMVCGPTPKGFARWTIALIKAQTLKRKIAHEIGDESIRLLLRNHDLKPWRETNVVCPKN